MPLALITTIVNYPGIVVCRLTFTNIVVCSSKLARTAEHCKSQHAFLVLNHVPNKPGKNSCGPGISYCMQGEIAGPEVTVQSLELLLVCALPYFYSLTRLNFFYN